MWPIESYALLLMSKNLEKHSLLISLSQGDREAFDMFYHSYYKQVFRYTYYILKDTSACREVVSNIFFSIWSYRTSLPKVQSVDAYLYTVSRNECRKYISEKQNYNNVSIDEIPLPIEIADDESPEERLIKEELETAISEIISTLPEKCRIIFMMSRNDGLANSEIAERLSISESTVRGQIKIAVDKLTLRIKELFPHLTLSVLLCALFG